jgi:ABC-2 type transport system permease protein
MLRDGRFKWSAAIVMTLLVAALGAGWKNYRDVSRQRTAAAASMREMWVNQPPKNPHSAAHYGIWAFKPKTPLSLVDHGVDQYVGVASWLEAHKQNEFRFRPAMDATAAQRFGEWTAAAVLQLLIPLLIIVLAFPAIAGERENGTLRQLASLGIRAGDLAVGKALGVAGALGILVVPAAIVGSIALLLASEDGAFAASLPRVAAMAVAYVAYFAAFLFVALFVSARVRTARVALIVLLAFWTANSLVGPRLLADVARRVQPTPSAFEFMSKVDEDLKKGIDGHSPDERTKALQASLLTKYGVSSVDSLPINFDAVAMQQGEEDGNRVFDRHYGALYDTYRRQNVIHQLGGFLAPLLAVRSLSMGLAGTDVEQHRRFAVAAEQYRRHLVKRMNDYMAENSRTGDWESTAGPELWRQVPPFEYTAPQLATVLGHHRWSIVILAAWCVVGLVALARMRRLEVQ